MNRYDAAELIRELGKEIDAAKESTSRMQDDDAIDGETLQWRRGFMAGLRRAVERVQEFCVDDAEEGKRVALLEAKLSVALASIDVYDSIVDDMENTIREWRSFVRILQRNKAQ